jgi:hypothetical protein
MTNYESAITRAIIREIGRARAKYPTYHSGHEGAAVIREEYEELWDGVKASKGTHVNGTTAIEAIQVAATAIRFIAELCDEGEFRATLAGFERTR